MSDSNFRPTWTVNLNETTITWKKILPSQGHSARFKHKQRVKSRSVWEHVIKGTFMKLTSVYTQHLNSLYKLNVYKYLILNSNVLSCLHSNDKLFFPNTSFSQASYIKMPLKMTKIILICWYLFNEAAPSRVFSGSFSIQTLHLKEHVTLSERLFSSERHLKGQFTQKLVKKKLTGIISGTFGHIS